MNPKRQAMTKTADLLAERKYGTGWNIDYHVLEGSPAYAAIFRAFAKLIDQHDKTAFWVYKREITRLSRTPPRASAYALWKFENEDYFHTSGEKLFVTLDHLKNWEELAERLRSRLGK